MAATFTLASPHQAEARHGRFAAGLALGIVGAAILSHNYRHDYYSGYRYYYPRDYGYYGYAPRYYGYYPSYAYYDFYPRWRWRHHHRWHGDNW
jgi:hypothetical protein